MDSDLASPRRYDKKKKELTKKIPQIHRGKKKRQKKNRGGTRLRHRKSHLHIAVGKESRRIHLFENLRSRNNLLAAIQKLFYREEEKRTLSISEDYVAYVDFLTYLVRI